MKEQLTALLTQHCANLKRDVHQIAGDLNDLQTLSGSDLTDLVRAVHTLKGSSGTMGFQTVFETARSLEGALRSFLDSRDAAHLPDIHAQCTQLQRVTGALEMTDSTLLAQFS